MAEDVVGTTLLGKLRVLRRVGEGAFGEVFEVEHVLTGHRRALKILRRGRASDLEAVTRFVREARVTSRLDSPHVAQVHDAGRLPDGRAYAVMDWLTGRSLRALLDAEGFVAPMRAAALVRQAAEGLAAVHAAGLLHRDLKPENLFVDGRDGHETVKLLDFGLVRDTAGVEASLTGEGALLGSPAYMSPRRLAGTPAEVRDDIHALGVVLYELVTGRRPYEAATLAGVIAAAHRGSYPSFDEVGIDAPPALVEVVSRALGRGEPFVGAGALAEAIADAEASRIGTEVDGLRILRTIARGGMGDVFEAASADGERFALKILRSDRLPDAKAVARMRKEAANASRCAADHVVRVARDGVDGRSGAPYIVMELLRGEDLGSEVSRGPLRSERAFDVLRAVARALDAVHAAGLVHRDVKPENVFVLAGAGVSIKLLDFGIAALAEPSPGESAATTASTIVGTPLYLAPEQADRSKPVGPAADRFALALLAYTLLVGEAFFRAEASRGLFAVMSALSQPRLEAPSARAARCGRALPPAFDAWFARAVAADPIDRFPTATEQIEALAASWDRSARPARRDLVIGAALAAAGALALGLVGFMRGESTPSPAGAESAGPTQAEPIAPPKRATATEPAPAAERSTERFVVSTPRRDTPKPSAPPRPSPAHPAAPAPTQRTDDTAHDSPF